LIGEAERAEIRAAIDRLREAAASEDHRLVREKIQRLNDTSHHLAEVIMDKAVLAAIKDRKASEVAEG
jgi:DnaJ-domain-containing protein 1